MKRLMLNLREADIRNVLAIIIIISTLIIQVMICFRPIPKDNHDIVITTIVLTFGMQAAVLAYYFGASKVDRKRIEGSETTNNV